MIIDMRILLIKMLLRLLSDFSHKKMKDDIIQEWLMSLSSDRSGYRGYYTIRKKTILDVLGIGVEQKEYWMNLGRLAELKQMNTLSMDLLKKQQKQSARKRDKSQYEKSKKRNA